MLSACALRFTSATSAAKDAVEDTLSGMAGCGFGGIIDLYSMASSSPFATLACPESATNWWSVCRMNACCSGWADWSWIAASQAGLSHCHLYPWLLRKSAKKVPV
jgi:hypothetical protein